MDPATILAAMVAGAIVAFVLSLVGGGGSILAVPLLVYLVGVPSTHTAIGTSAIGVALAASVSLIGHARAGNVRWPCAGVFSVFGMVGAACGAWLGKQLDGSTLLAGFGALMVAVGLVMLRGRKSSLVSEIRLSRDNARTLIPRLSVVGGTVGMFSGFFGIGGGFLIVPGLMLASAMPIKLAIGTSLVAITAFGATTAASYALANYIDWMIVGGMIMGSIPGALAGRSAAQVLARRKNLLERLFAALVVVIGGFVIFTA